MEKVERSLEWRECCHPFDQRMLRRGRHKASNYTRTPSRNRIGVTASYLSNYEDDVRGVSAMRTPNLRLAILRAAENGQITAVSVLLDFAFRHGIEPSSIIG